MNERSFTESEVEEAALAWLEAAGWRVARGSDVAPDMPGAERADYGEVVDGKMRFNPFGELVQMTWHGLPHHVDDIVLDAFVVMPNHVHGIIVLMHSVVGATHASPLPNASPLQQPSPRPCGPQPQSIPTIVGSFKSAVTKRVNQMRGTAGAPVWQRNYYEHIIRNDESLNSIREYIINNPLQWELDRENPNIVGAGFKPAPNEDEPWRI